MQGHQPWAAADKRLRARRTGPTPECGIDGADRDWWRTREERPVEMQPVTSDSLRAVGYDRAHHVLRVAFKSGGVYDYYDVSARLYEELRWPHPWLRVGGRVLAHRYRRVDR